MNYIEIGQDYIVIIVKIYDVREKKLDTFGHMFSSWAHTTQGSNEFYSRLTQVMDVVPGILLSHGLAGGHALE